MKLAHHGQGFGAGAETIKGIGQGQPTNGDGREALAAQRRAARAEALQPDGGRMVGLGGGAAEGADPGVITGGIHLCPFGRLVGGGAEVGVYQAGQAPGLRRGQVALAQVQAPGAQPLPGSQQGKVGPVIDTNHGPSTICGRFFQGLSQFIPLRVRRQGLAPELHQREPRLTQALDLRGQRFRARGVGDGVEGWQVEHAFSLPVLLRPSW